MTVYRNIKMGPYIYLIVCNKLHIIIERINNLIMYYNIIIIIATLEKKMTGNIYK